MLTAGQAPNIGKGPGKGLVAGDEDSGLSAAEAVITR